MQFNLQFPKNKPFDVVGMGLNSVDLLSLVSEFPTSNSKMKVLRFARSGGGQVATAMVALTDGESKQNILEKRGAMNLDSSLWNQFVRKE